MAQNYHFIMPTGSVGWESGQGTVGMSCLCYLGPQMRVIQKGLGRFGAGGSTSKMMSSRSAWPRAGRAEAGFHLCLLAALSSVLASSSRPPQVSARFHLKFRRWVLSSQLEGRWLRRNSLDQLRQLGGHEDGAVGSCAGDGSEKHHELVQLSLFKSRHL